jgi:hypothetical protein
MKIWAYFWPSAINSRDMGFNPLPVIMKNVGMKGVHCQRYDWSSLDMLPTLQLVFSDCLPANDTIGLLW